MQNQKIVENNLESLISAKEKLQLEISQGTTPWNIIVDPFVNPRPYKPNLNKSIIYGLSISLILAFAITLLIERIDNVFHNPSEIEKIIKLPILGFVPFFSFSKENEDSESSQNQDITLSDFISNPNQEIVKNINFIFQETFRNIYTSIKFSASDKEIKTICLTSTVPQEGKSLCSLCLQ